MKTVSLSGSPRENVGKKDAKSLRINNQVPCVMYGGENQIHFSANQIDLSKIIYSPEVSFFEINIGGETYKAAIKEIQFHPVSDKLVHVDFQQLFDDKEVKLELPVKTVGTSIGVRNGGKLSVNFRRLMVRGLPTDFPDVIEIDITNVRIGQNIRIKQINLPGVTVLQDPEAVIVAVKRGRVSVDIAEEEETEGGEEGETAAAEAPAES